MQFSIAYSERAQQHCIAQVFLWAYPVQHRRCITIYKQKEDLHTHMSHFMIFLSKSVQKNARDHYGMCNKPSQGLYIAYFKEIMYLLHTITSTHEIYNFLMANFHTLFPVHAHRRRRKQLGTRCRSFPCANCKGKKSFFSVDALGVVDEKNLKIWGNFWNWSNGKLWPYAKKTTIAYG